MTDSLRWSDCDDMAFRGDSMGALLCRTSKLNDHAHQTDNRLASLETTVSRWGIVTAGAAIIGVGFQVFKALHG